MLGATVLVPALAGLPTSVALCTAGLGTLLFIFVTRFQVPIFLGSSFAFIAPLIAVSMTYGWSYAFGGVFASGVLYLIVSLIIKIAGLGWLQKAFPPVVIGPVIACIGLSLTPVGVSMATQYNGEYSLIATLIALFTLAVIITISFTSHSFLASVPIVIGLASGYIFTAIIKPSMINTSAIMDAPWIQMPVPMAFQIQFAVMPILIFLIVSFATICEHIGDIYTVSSITGKQFYKEPGLHRTLLGDGVASISAGILGSVPSTSYGENAGVLAITRRFEVRNVAAAAIIAIILSFCGKITAVIAAIPTPVLGGASLLLYGLIASSGLKQLVDAGVNYTDKRNLIISAIILGFGIGGMSISYTTQSGLLFSLSGVALAALIGVILNLVIPRQRLEKAS
jgi:uracil permease